jgi:ATHILA ORF-1 family
MPALPVGKQVPHGRILLNYDFFEFYAGPVYEKRRFNRRYHVDDFWESVTEHRGQGEHRAQSIRHPVIHCIQRALALTIFVRNENTDKVTIEDMKLLDLMLDPEGELERPDLILHMVRHLVKIREEIK